MTYGDGKPFLGRSGERITHKLQPATIQPSLPSV